MAGADPGPIPRRSDESSTLPTEAGVVDVKKFSCNRRSMSVTSARLSEQICLRGVEGEWSHGAKESDCGRAARRDSLQTRRGPDFSHVTLMEPSLVADVGPTVRWAARGVAL